jgi:hypothetical protein
MRLRASRFVSSSTVPAEITGVIGLISTALELMHNSMPQDQKNLIDDPGGDCSCGPEPRCQALRW